MGVCLQPPLLGLAGLLVEPLAEDAGPLPGWSQMQPARSGADPDIRPCHLLLAPDRAGRSICGGAWASLACGTRGRSTRATRTGTTPVPILYPRLAPGPHQFLGTPSPRTPRSECCLLGPMQPNCSSPRAVLSCEAGLQGGHQLATPLPPWEWQVRGRDLFLKTCAEIQAVMAGADSSPSNNRLPGKHHCLTPQPRTGPWASSSGLEPGGLGQCAISLAAPPATVLAPGRPQVGLLAQKADGVESASPPRLAQPLLFT